MSILVKGISMPHGEDEGIMLAIYDGKAYHIGTKQEHDAVEVPPHGDLIDRNALLAELGSNHIHGIEAIINSNPYKNDWTDGLHTAWRCIDDAPTVIESEGET